MTLVRYVSPDLLLLNERTLSVSHRHALRMIEPALPGPICKWEKLLLRLLRRRGAKFLRSVWIFRPGMN